jgi:hypothetical protein
MPASSGSITKQESSHSDRPELQQTQPEQSHNGPNKPEELQLRQPDELGMQPQQLPENPHDGPIKPDELPFVKPNESKELLMKLPVAYNKKLNAVPIR